jgi:Tfp pilus assembly protein PilF
MGPKAWSWRQHGAGQLCLLATAALVGLAGCETAAQERVRHYNADGVHLFQQGNYQDARESFALALELQAEDPALFYNLGQCCDRLGDNIRAEQYYMQCLQRSTNHADCRHALAVLLYRTGRKVEATSMIEDWLARQPNLADAYALDGWRLRQDNALPDAQGRLQQALARDPHNVRANVELGILYEAINLPERSAVLYQRALAQNPNQAEVAARLMSLRNRNIGRPLPD